MRHQLARILERGELRDPLLAGRSLTVTEVSVSPDLRKAAVFIAPLGGEGADEIMEPLQKAASFLRHRLGGIMHLKHLPQLTFLADNSFDYAAQMGDLIHEAKTRDGASADLHPDDEAPLDSEKDARDGA